MPSIHALRHALAQAVARFHAEGVRGVWFRALSKLGYRRLILVARPLEEPIPDVEPRIPLAIDLLQRSEVAEYLEFRPDTAAAEVEARLEGGQLCFVARHEGRIVSARWAAVGRAWIDYLSCQMPMAADEVCPYDQFTRVRYRGQDAAPATTVAMLRHLREAGYRRTVGTILPGNEASVRASAKTGYRPIGRIGYVAVGSWRRYFCAIDGAVAPVRRQRA